MTTCPSQTKCWDMRLSIGIFAHNEEDNIALTLGSLFRQSLLASPQASGLASIEVLCLANGCRDRTVEVARKHRHSSADGVAYRVIDLKEPGKSRTWNAYVHQLSDPSADYLILMDADIIFDGDRVLQQLLEALASNRHAQVATDTPVKSFLRDDHNLSLADRGSLAASGQKSLVGMLCGQLYCGRAASLRQIWLPPELPVEDGYLAAMVTTTGFTEPTDLDRIAWVPDARHFYRTHHSVSGFIAHEARIIVGSVINSWLFSILWSEGRHRHAGAFVRERNERAPDWLSKLIDQKVRQGGAWIVPQHFMWWRFDSLKGGNLPGKLRRLPIASAATALNLVACVRANKILKRANAAAHW